MIRGIITVFFVAIVGMTTIFSCLGAISFVVMWLVLNVPFVKETLQLIVIAIGIIFWISRSSLQNSE